MKKIVRSILIIILQLLLVLYIYEAIRASYSVLLVVPITLIIICLMAFVESILSFLISKLLGYEFYAYALGNFKIIKENGKLKFKNLKIKEFTFGPKMIAPKGKINRKKLLLSYLSVICFYIIGAYLVFIFTRHASGDWSSIGKAYVLITSIVIISTLFPSERKIDVGSGTMLYNLFLVPEWIDSMIEAEYLFGLSLRGVRPREFNGLNKRGTKISDKTASSYMIATYFFLLDHQRIKPMRKYIKFFEEYIDGKIDRFNGSYCSEVIFYHSINQNIEKAKEYYPKIEKKKKKAIYDTNDCRVEAYYSYYILKDKKRALMYCDLGLSNHDFLYKGQMKMEHELIMYLKDIMSGKVKNPWWSKEKGM